MKGETCQSLPNNITTIGGKCPLPAGEWKILVKGGAFLTGGENLSRSDFDHLNFSKLKTSFCKYWTANGNGRGATTTAKNEVFIGL